MVFQFIAKTFSGVGVLFHFNFINHVLMGLTLRTGALPGFGLLVQEKGNPNAAIYSLTPLTIVCVQLCSNSLEEEPHMV